MTARRTAFVFAGGGSLGAIQVGMLRVLLAAGVCPDFVIGSSVGALNAAYFAGAPTLEGVLRLEKIWSGLRRGDVFPITVRRVLGVLRRPGYLIDPGPLRRLIQTNLPYARLEDAAIPAYIMATDFQGLQVSFSQGPAVEAILASAAIPGVFPPVEIGGQFLMDGAVATNTPICLAAEIGASRIIVLPTGYACALKEPPKSAVARALHAITLMIAWQLAHDLERLPDSVEVHLVPALCPLDVSPFDFSSSRSLMERAADTTKKWIERGGLTRRANPRDLAAHRHRTDFGTHDPQPDR